MVTSSQTAVKFENNNKPISGTSIIDQLGVLEKIMAYHKLYDEFEDEVSRLSQKRQDLTDPAIYLFVFGKGKFGKSSLINQLLGRTVAKTSIVPMTWRIDFFRPLSEEKARSTGGEFAEIRRAKSGSRERVSIEEAQRLCDEQERDVLKHMRKREKAAKNAASGEPFPENAYLPAAELAVENQIIEVNWYYRNLALPASTVLVDTPGLFQDRGAMRSQAKLLSSTDGVVFENPDAAYEYYYPRADIVLWLFRADLLKDRDTRDALRGLSEQKKRILGIVTHLDALSSAQQQQDAIQQLKQEYGDYVEVFLPVITGGETPNVGYGIPRVREQVERLGPMAAQIKLEATQRFISYVAQCCDQWLTSKGTILIGNITKLAVYCNLTSEALLNEVEYCHSMLLETLNLEVMSQRNRSDLGFLIETILRKEMPQLPAFNQAKRNEAAAVAALQTYYQRRMSEEFRLDHLHKDAQERLQVTTSRILAAGRQAAAGRRLEQVVLKSGGRAESRSMESIIRPPDVSRLAVTLPPIQIPLISVSMADLVLDFLGATFIGGVMRYFGWKSSEEKFAPLLLQAEAATVAAINTLPKTIKQMLVGYTKEAAVAIIDGADEAISRVYSNHNLSRLKTEAAILDCHLKELRGIRAQSLPKTMAQVERAEGLQFSFETLYSLWSPRDNARTAVIQMFCDWFAKEQSKLQYTAQKWYSETVVDAPDNKIISECCNNFLKESKQQDGMTKWATISYIHANKKLKGTFLTRSDELSDYIKGYNLKITTQIRQICLWDDQVNFLDVDFEHFQLAGIAHDFSNYLAESFTADFQNEIMQQTFRVGAEELSGAFDPRKQVFNAPILSIAGGTGIVSGAIGNSLFHKVSHSDLIVSDVGAGVITSLAVIGGTHAVQKALSHYRRRKQLVQLLSARIQSEVDRVADAAFTAAIFKVTPELARDLIGSKTLVKKRALDFAAEGQFFDRV